MVNPIPYHEDRPWGSFERFTLNEPSTVKLITVKPNQAFSLQKHEGRDEWWKIIQGNGIVRIGDKEENIEIEKEYFIKRGTLHRITAGTSTVVFLEIAFGNFNENDIERTEDFYGRK